MYTGDTLSAVQAPEGFDPPQGGIPALANAIGEYQRKIVTYNQLRVADAGGDPTTVRADRENGMLGEHPYLLLDYGGWERPNDYAGAPYVGLCLRFFKDYGYSAVGSTLYRRLEPERWQQYAAVDSGVKLLVSAGEELGDALPSVRFATREVHGSLWCIVCVPLPRIDDDPFERIRQYADEAWDTVLRARAQYSILLLAGGPDQLYRDLGEDGRFTLVIGAPAKLALMPGYGDVVPQRTLLLPDLHPSGRQLGICHLQFGNDGSAPTKYHLLLNDCIEDESQPYPYRTQAQEAVASHEQLVEEHTSAAKIGNP